MIGCVYYYETRKKAYLSLIRQRVRKADFSQGVFSPNRVYVWPNCKLVIG